MTLLYIFFNYWRKSFHSIHCIIIIVYYSFNMCTCSEIVSEKKIMSCVYHYWYNIYNRMSIILKFYNKAKCNWMMVYLSVVFCKHLFTYKGIQHIEVYVCDSDGLQVRTSCIHSTENVLNYHSILSVLCWQGISPSFSKLSWQMLHKVWKLWKWCNILVFLFIKVQFSCMQFWPIAFLSIRVKLYPLSVAILAGLHGVSHDCDLRRLWLTAVFLRCVWWSTNSIILISVVDKRVKGENVWTPCCYNPILWFASRHFSMIVLFVVIGNGNYTGLALQ